MGGLPWQLPLLLSLLLTLSSLPSSSSSFDSEIFQQCLQNNSHPSHPISQAIYTPQNPSYSSILKAYIRNLRFTTPATPKPVVIITAMHESHVQSAVLCGKKHSLQLKIRSGGHDYEGTSYVSSSPFFLLDMFNLRSVDIDLEKETAWVGAGATLGELFYRIAEKSRIHGFPAGVCPTVGVGGHFVGAGYGNMMRKYGLSVDNIIDARLVDVSGRILDRKSMGEDLFWAIRGGGASFGVLLSFKVKLVQVPETVTVFRVEKTLDQNATEIVYQWQHIAHKVERDLFIRLVLDVVKRDEEKTVRASFTALFLGDCKRLVSTMDESFPQLGFTESDCVETSWVKSIPFWANISMDKPVEVLLERAPERVFSLKRKSDYVKEPIPKDGLEFIWKKMIELEAPSMAFNPYGGRMAEIPETETPFPHRSGNLWKIQYLANWNEVDIETSGKYIELMRKLYSYMTPFVSKNPRQAFYSYKDLDLGSADWKRKDCWGGRGDDYGIRYFMGNFERLVKIKSKVDGDNFFRHEQSIPTLSMSGGCCEVGDNSYADVINGGYAIL